MRVDSARQQTPCPQFENFMQVGVSLDLRTASPDYKASVGKVTNTWICSLPLSPAVIAVKEAQGICLFRSLSHAHARTTLDVVEYIKIGSIRWNQSREQDWKSGHQKRPSLKCQMAFSVVVILTHGARRDASNLMSVESCGWKRLRIHSLGYKL